MPSCMVASLPVFLVMVISFLPGLVLSRPIKTEAHHVLEYAADNTRNYEEGKYFEGDLAVSKELIEAFYGRKNTRIATAGVRELQYLWPNNIIIYELDNSLSPFLTSIVLTAMEVWSSNTCIRFKQREEEPNYIKIKSSEGGCFSNHVGFSGSEQILNLEIPGCGVMGIAMHELGHNLGLWHEQSRPDRDNYVKVIQENIKPGEVYNFEKRNEETINTQNLGYDYDSIMHYPEYAFSRNGGKTIEVVNMEAYEEQGYPVLGQRERLSSSDIAVVNKLYNC